MRRDDHNALVSHEVFQHVPFPFADGQFPHNLGAVVQRTVLIRAQPARIVIHDADNNWLVGDGVNHPNAPGVSVVACMRQVADDDPAVAELASLPIGYVAEHDGPESPWEISIHEWPDE